jgi:hypothetical protein
VETAFDVNSKTIEVLGRIGGVFSDTIKAWKSFNSNNSHICFFRTTEDAAISSHSKRSLRAIKAIFQEMEKDHNKIMFLKQKCSEFSSTVSHKLYLFPSSFICNGSRQSNVPNEVEASPDSGKQGCGRPEWKDLGVYGIGKFVWVHARNHSC